MPSAYATNLASNQASGNKDQSLGLWNKETPWLNAVDVGSEDKYKTPTGQAQYYDDSHGIFYQDGRAYIQPHAEESALKRQQYFTNHFNENIPTMANQMYGQAAQSINGQMNQGIQNVRQGNSSRGLLYSGINAGQEGGVRAQASGQLAQAKSNINQGLISAGQNMQSNTIQSGITYQQMQQSLNNSIYQNAMAQLSGDTAMTNSLISSAATVGGIAAFA